MTSIGLTDIENYSNIADAIREKLQVSTSYKPVDMASAIISIQPQNNYYTTIGYYPSLNYSIFDNNLISIPGYAFYSCSNLTSVSFPNCTTIGSSAFYFCSRLESIYLFNSKIVQLLDTNAFMFTPISTSSYLGHFGSIYVPYSLVAQYKSATNWSIYSSRIRGG